MICAGEITGFLHVTRVSARVDPVNAEYRIVFAPLGGRLRGRRVSCQGLDALTDFLRRAGVPIPEIERVWQTLVRRRVLKSAQSIGAWVNPIFYFTDTVSLRWAGGFQTALDNDRPVVTGSLITDSAGTNFFRVNNRQSEISLWWTPGPFTFAFAWNVTKTDFRNVNAAGTASASRHNENNKFEFISWWSF